MTRPLGASVGDYLSQPTDVGGLSLGTTVTSITFLLTILAVGSFLTITWNDEGAPLAAEVTDGSSAA